MYQISNYINLLYYKAMFFILSEFTHLPFYPGVYMINVFCILNETENSVQAEEAEKIIYFKF